jgi:ParB/RepB/Spo0J family partition protein
MIVNQDPEETRLINYEIVVGSRRYTAAKALDLETVPCIIRTLTDDDAKELQIIENLQRLDVSPIEEARGYQALLAADMATAEARRDIKGIAKRIGKSESYVYQRLKLCNLTEPAQHAMEAGRLPAGHGVIVARLDPDDQAKALRALFPGREPEPQISVKELQQKFRKRPPTPKPEPPKAQAAKPRPKPNGKVTAQALIEMRATSLAINESLSQGTTITSPHILRSIFDWIYPQAARLPLFRKFEEMRALIIHRTAHPTDKDLARILVALTIAKFPQAFVANKFRKAAAAELKAKAKANPKAGAGRRPRHAPAPPNKAHPRPRLRA